MSVITCIEYPPKATATKASTHGLTPSDIPSSSSTANTTMFS